MAIRQKELREILSLHRQRYPLMEPVDYGKLLYQNEYGPEHMISSPDAVLRPLRQEWENAVGKPEDPGAAAKDSEIALMEAAGRNLPVPLSAPFIEEIGNHLYRFHLTAGYDLTAAAPLLARLFFLTAGQPRGTLQGLKKKLVMLQEREKQPDFPTLTPWLTDYIRMGCPAPRHSEAFRQAYAPHYRILRDEYAIYFPILYQIEGLLQRSEPVLLAVDGPCGSGKSSLATLLAEVFPARVLHMDDYYLPLEQRLPDWERTPCGNMDLERFLREVLLPASTGGPIACRPYSCQQGRLLETQMLPPAPLTIVEGSYSHHPMLAPCYDLKLFLRCRRQEQLNRLKRRENTRLNAYLQRWIPLEETYYRTYDIMSKCDLEFDNTSYFI